jgi:uncharacterized protein YycO
MIALYRGVSPLSWAIRSFTRTDYSHAAWILPNGTCIEAWHPGGVRHRYSPYAGHTRGTLVDYYGLSGMDAAKRQAVEDFLLDEIGEPYDIGGVLRFVTRRRAANAKAWFCSELVVEALNHAGLPILRAPAHELAPGHLPWSLDLSPLAGSVSEDEWHDGLAGALCPKYPGKKS